MHFLSRNFLYILLIIFQISWTNASISDYINGVSKYLGFSRHHDEFTDLEDEEITQKILYEVSRADEKFIAEATKLTGVAISDLDFCQQRVILKLKTDCHQLNDEQLAKIAVHLLNCQSYVEGRKIYPCTEEMTIKDCTINMDADTWTSYHLMSNRARAVCYTIRQIQFRGLAEQTVNRLMDASRAQLKSIRKIVDGQENIKIIAENTFDTLTKTNEQQKDLQKAQLHGQLAIENNIMRLIDEKRLIHETHNKLIEMTREVYNRLEDSVKIIGQQNDDNKINHNQLLTDIALIRSKAEDLFKKIDAYSHILFEQNTKFKQQYETTLKNLNEVNRTVHGLINLMSGTKEVLEEKLTWISTTLGGTDKSLERLYLVVSHAGFILVAMLICAFLSVKTSTRLIVTILPPMNLVVALYEQEYFDILTLCGIIVLFVIGQAFIAYIISYRKSIRQSICMLQSKTDSKVSLNNNHSKQFDISSIQEEMDDTDNNQDQLTPPISRIGYYTPSLRSRKSHSRTPSIINMSLKMQCQAMTRAGTICKISTLPGRDFCHRHQYGDSIMG